MILISTPPSSPLLQKADHGAVADVGIIDEQLLFSALEESLKLLAGIERADDKVVPFRHVQSALGISLKQLQRLLNAMVLRGHHAETPAVIDVQISEIEGQDVELFIIDDHKLVVVADQIVRCARHRHPGLEQPHLKLSQHLLAAAVYVGNERVNGDAPGDGIVQRALDITPVEAEDNDLNAPLGSLNALNQRDDSVTRLHQQLHAISNRLARLPPRPSHCRAAWRPTHLKRQRLLASETPILPDIEFIRGSESVISRFARQRLSA